MKDIPQPKHIKTCAIHWSLEFSGKAVVYSELTRDDLLQINGINHVELLHGDALIIYVSGRYDHAEIEAIITAMASLLKKQLYDKSVGGLKVGESAWVVPWAIHRDEDDNLYIHRDRPAGAEQGGTVELRITGAKDCIIIDRQHYTNLVTRAPSLSTEVNLRVDGWLPVKRATTQVDLELPSDLRQE